MVQVDKITTTNKRVGENAGLTSRNINFLFCYSAAAIRATELYSSKNFILNFKPAYRQAGKKSTTVSADGMHYPQFAKP